MHLVIAALESLEIFVLNFVSSFFFTIEIILFYFRV